MSTVTIPLGAWVDMLKADLAVKDAQLKVAREALEFYANRIYGAFYPCETGDDYADELFSRDRQELKDDAGKIATEALEKLKQIGGGE